MKFSFSLISDPEILNFRFISNSAIPLIPMPPIPTKKILFIFLNFINYDFSKMWSTIVFVANGLPKSLDEFPIFSSLSSL